jgi:tetratricopeptide (TPR) repeat protein
MNDFSKKVRSALGKAKKGVKRSMATDSHREASKYLEQGRKKYNDKHYESAEKYFQRAVDADGQYALAHYMLGLVMYRRDESEGAIRSWNRCIALDRTSKTAAKAYAKLEAHQKKTGQSIAELEDRLKG